LRHVVEHSIRNPGGQRLQEAHGFAFHDLFGNGAKLRVVDGVFQLVSVAGRAQVAIDLEVDFELLGPLALARSGAVAALKRHALEQDSVHNWQLFRK